MAKAQDEGPIIGAFIVGDNYDRTKDGSIYREKPRRNFRSEHVVMIIGWGNKDGIDYWIYQNSYGRNWGE